MTSECRLSRRPAPTTMAWTTIVAGCVLLAALGCHGTAWPVPPNIILYVVDTMRFDALHCNGNADVQTPAMDRLAREGLRFERAYANASWTRPSMATLLTGVYPSTHGAIGRQDAMRKGLRTLASALHARGYRTAAVFANPNVSEAFGFAEGFDDFIELYPARTVHDPGVPRERVGTADHVVQRAIDWLHARSAQPFFLLVFSVDPHAPYEPPPPYDSMYDPDYRGTVDGSIKSVFGLLVAAKLGAQPAPRDVRHLRALYQGEVTFNDTQLARLLADLDSLRLSDSTLVILTSDHGEEFYEHGYGDHGHSLYEELIHVPLIMRWPGHIAAPQLYSGAVQLADLYPTLLRLAGSPPAQGPGRDLGVVIAGGSAAGVPSEVFAEERLDTHNLRMMMLDHRKLIYDAARPAPLVFDLLQDPGERHPIDGWPPGDLVFAMENVEQHNRPLPDSSGRTVRAAELPESARAAMEALGYGDPTKNP